MRISVHDVLENNGHTFFEGNTIWGEISNTVYYLYLILEKNKLNWSNYKLEPELFDLKSMDYFTFPPHISITTMRSFYPLTNDFEKNKILSFILEKTKTNKLIIRKISLDIFQFGCLQNNWYGYLVERKGL